MLRLFSRIGSGFLTVAVSTFGYANSNVSDSAIDTEARAKSVVASLTFEEKAALLSGRSFWEFGGVPRLNIPSTTVADCGHGVVQNGKEVKGSTCLPTGVGMAATWDPVLMEAAGELLGRECKALGVGMLLGPMVNLHRLPVGGRNYETFSEDPFLTGVVAAAIVRGVQRTGVAACVKGVAGNNQQKFQTTHDALVDEQTLQELYLKQFKYIIEHAKPAALMMAYNRLNGEYCSENSWLMENYLRRTLKYSGILLSDWRAVHSIRALDAGLDLEMPGPGKYLVADAIKDALDQGRITGAELDERVERVLAANLKFGAGVSGGEIDSPRHRALALEIAEKSMVLLKNESVLPLNLQQLGSIAVIGPNSSVARLGGSGSASVTPSSAISPIAGIQTKMGSKVKVVHAEGNSPFGGGEVMRGEFSHLDGKGSMQSGLLAEFFDDATFKSPNVFAKPVDSIEFAWAWASPAPGIRNYTYGVRLSGEVEVDKTLSARLVYQGGGARIWVDDKLVHDGWDPEVDGGFEARYKATIADFSIPQKKEKRVQIRIEYRRLTQMAAVRLERAGNDADSLLKQAVAAARSADVAVVCVGLSAFDEGGNQDRSAFNLPPGQDELIEAVAKVNPKTVVVLNGATAIAMPWLPKVAAVIHAFYPGEEGGNALANLLCGDVAPGGRLPDTIPVRLEDVPAMAFYPGTPDRVVFGEGLFVGYRHFASSGVKPLYPFGFGLTYTTFQYSGLRTSSTTMSEGDTLKVSVDVQNTGEREGDEVVQLYIGQRKPSSPRPAKELKAFRKVKIQRGQTTRIEFSVSASDLEQYSIREGRWLTESGEYSITVGPNSAQGLSAAFTVHPKS